MHIYYLEYSYMVKFRSEMFTVLCSIIIELSTLIRKEIICENK